MRNLLTCVTAGGLLLLVTISSYPFEPRQFLMLSLWSFILSVVVSVTIVLVQMDGDEVFSRVGGTTPHQFTWDRTFSSALFTHGVLPVAGLLAAQFPAIGAGVQALLEIFKQQEAENQGRGAEDQTVRGSLLSFHLQSEARVSSAVISVTCLAKTPGRSQVLNVPVPGAWGFCAVHAPALTRRSPAVGGRRCERGRRLWGAAGCHSRKTRQPCVSCSLVTSWANRVARSWLGRCPNWWPNTVSTW
jgi:hypothetical protein